MAPEITPIKGLDLKPMYSYFYASGTTNSAPRQGRGGVNTTTAFTDPDGDWRPRRSTRTATRSVSMRGCGMGPFSLDPTLMYQFGNREVVVPGTQGAVHCDQLLELFGHAAGGTRLAREGGHQRVALRRPRGLPDRPAAPRRPVHVHLG